MDLRCSSMAIYIVGIGITIGVLILSLMTISKGYAYKHSVDPLSDPTKEEQEKHL